MARGKKSKKASKKASKSKRRSDKALDVDVKELEADPAEEAGDEAPPKTTLDAPSEDELELSATAASPREEAESAEFADEAEPETPPPSPDTKRATKTKTNVDKVDKVDKVVVQAPELSLSPDIDPESDEGLFMLAGIPPAERDHALAPVLLKGFRLFVIGDYGRAREVLSTIEKAADAPASYKKAARIDEEVTGLELGSLIFGGCLVTFFIFILIIVY